MTALTLKRDPKENTGSKNVKNSLEINSCMIDVSEYSIFFNNSKFLSSGTRVS